MSDGITVDTTPPEPEYRQHLGPNLVTNPSFEDIENMTVTDWSDIESNISPCQLSVPRDWSAVSSADCIQTVHTGTNVAKDGRAFMLLRGAVQQSLTNLTLNGRYRVSFYSSHLPLSTDTISNKEGYMSIGGDTRVFLMYTRDGRSDVTTPSDYVLIWHHHIYYFIADDSDAMFSIGSMDIDTLIAVDDVIVQSTTTEMDTGSQNGSHVTVHTVFVRDWSSVHAAWSFTDSESPIVDYMWAIGKIIYEHIDCMCI
jgi:hypothetical protein